MFHTNTVTLEGFIQNASVHLHSTGNIMTGFINVTDQWEPFSRYNMQHAAAPAG